MSKFLLAMAATLAMTSAALADPIEGNWKTEAGSTARIASCGSAMCITLTDGAHQGKQIGRFSPSGSNQYSGQITDPNDDKTYTGYATLNGNTLSMQGCVMAVFCRTQTWTRL